MVSFPFAARLVRWLVGFLDGLLVGSFVDLLVVGLVVRGIHGRLFG